MDINPIGVVVAILFFAFVISEIRLSIRADRERRERREAERQDLKVANEYLDALRWLFKDYARLYKIEKAVRGLIEYRDRNTINFQLEKADDWLNMIRAELERKP